MSEMRDWDDHYQTGCLPWDDGVPDPMLVRAFEEGLLPSGRALEIGCGTGTNARYLAEAGWEVVALDVAPTAVELARAEGGRVRYAVHDVLAEPAPGAPYDLVFDRGCFHTFDDASARATFAKRVADALRTGGCWLTLAGSTEGPPRDTGPPRRSARDLVQAIEPVLELVELRSAAFHDHVAWSCLARKRAVPAQPSTRH